MTTRRTPKDSASTSAPARATVKTPVGDDRYWAARADEARAELEDIARKVADGKLGPRLDAKALAEKYSGHRAR